jgi:Xaa-Pro aminopeptidase
VSASTTALVAAENRARELFDACVERGLVVAGKSERMLSDEVCELASIMFGVRRYWHKRIVRAGRNTLLTYSENPPDLVIQPDDVVVFDFGPVFDEWEADLGRSFALGDDPRKHRLVTDVADAWERGSAYYREHPDVTAQELYAFVCELARGHGWEFGHVHCGHPIGRFPHARGDDEGAAGYLSADNPVRLRDVEVELGLRWILEIHFVDRVGGFGAFQEALLLDADDAVSIE